MSANQFDLLRQKRFLPLFIVQFLGALHDNIFRYALVAVLLFQATGGNDLAQADEQTKMLVTLATALFVLPFVLFSALAGQYTDKYDKAKVIRYVKAVEIAVAVLGAISLLSGSIPLSFFTLFLLGAQSTFFGPSKYSILPQHLAEDELIGGNALLGIGTFLAILLGTIIGMTIVNVPFGLWILSGMIMGSAIVGYVASLSIPEAKPYSDTVKVSYHIPRETWRMLLSVFESPYGMVMCALGIGWFWFMGSVFLSQMPNMTRMNLGANEHVSAFFMVLFSIGIGLGGLFNNSLLKGRVEAAYVPLAALGISFFSIDLYFATRSFEMVHNATPDQELIGLMEFFSYWRSWRIVLDLTLIAIFAGLFVIPLNAIFQHECPDDTRSRLMAGLMIMNSGFVAAASLVSIALFAIGFTVPMLFFTVALANVLVALYICQLLPDYLLKTVMQVIFKTFYKVEVKGLENFEKAGDRVIIVSNHVSYLDAPILAAFLPGKPMFAVNSHVANWWWVRPFLKLVDAYPLDPTNPFAMKGLIKEVSKDKMCVIFPEGRLTETGALMKVYDGPGMIADKAGAKVLPIRLDGVQHTPFSRLKGKVPLRTFPKITMTILEPREFEVDAEIRGRVRRKAAGRQLYDVMEEMMFITKDREQTLFTALMKARHVNGDKAAILEDIERKPITFKDLVQRSNILGRKVAKRTKKGEAVGVMLPNSAGAVITFFALQAQGRVPAMINFSAGEKAILSACQSAEVKTVLTSRRFIEMGRLTELADAMAEKVKLVYLEDIRDEVGLIDKLWGGLAPMWAGYFHRRLSIRPDDPAVILFTSGSEGMPKGVVLSHANIMSNIVQLSSRVDFNRQDIVFNCLPMFHSFGLTGGTLLPVLSGVRAFQYPSPLHYRIVPELIYSTNATIMFGTDTFLNGYARMADPYDFYRMRYIFAGAEKVKDETRQLYADRFGVRILEGYGATETAPGLTLNSPMHMKKGSVGRLLPGLEYKLEDVPGVDEGGRLFVRGPNIMLGYYKDDKPGQLQPPEEGWYDTGDIVDVDDEGFVTILGRAKRFAKIAGEMVSLSAVEVFVKNTYPEHDHAVVALPDKRKGEQLVLLTTNGKADKAELSKAASEKGLSELSVPKVIVTIDKMPVLGSGKTDYPAVTEHVKENM